MELLLLAVPLAIAGAVLLAVGPAVARRPDTPEDQGLLLKRLSPIVGGAALVVALVIAVRAVTGG